MECNKLTWLSASILVLSSCFQEKIEEPAPPTSQEILNECIVNSTPSAFTFDVGTNNQVTLDASSFDFNSSCNSDFEFNYIWSLGDGSTIESNDPSLSYTYEEPGIYDIVLIVGYDEELLRHTQTIDVELNYCEIPPEEIQITIHENEVDFDASLLNIYTDHGCTAVTPNEYKWHFESDQFLNTDNAITSYTYITKGDYIASVEIINGQHSDEIIIKFVIEQDVPNEFTLVSNPIIDQADSVQFSVNQTPIADNQLTYEWHSSDGQVSNEPIFDIYFPELGDYEISVTITDINGNTWNDSLNYSAMYNYCHYAPISPSLPVFNISNTLLMDVTFTIEDDVDGCFVYDGEYIWDFGDGNTIVSSEKSIVHTYEQAGEFLITLNDSNNQTFTQTLVLDEAIICTEQSIPGFEVLEKNGLDVSFDTTLNRDCNYFGSYIWDFGDGSSLETDAQIISHSYDSIGEYVVTRTLKMKTKQTSISTAINLDTTNQTDSFFVFNFLELFANTIQTSSTSASNIAVLEQQIANETLMNLSANSYSYEWSFGDFEFSSSNNSTHQYLTNDLFYATLTVSDLSTTDSFQIPFDIQVNTPAQSMQWPNTWPNPSIYTQDPSLCDSGSTSDIEIYGNNQYTFNLSGNECMTYSQSSSSQRAVVPVVLMDDLPEGILISETAKIYSGNRTTFTLEVTNQGVDAACFVSINNYGLIGESNEIITIDSTNYLYGDALVSSTGALRDTCLLPNNTLLMSGIIDFDSHDISSLSYLIISDLSVSTYSNPTPTVPINPIEMSWTNNSYDLEFYNSSDVTMDFSDKFAILSFFDEYGFLITHNYINYGVLDLVAGPNETIIFNDTYSSFNERISKILYTLDWEIVE